ncbi:hypothetical protein F0P96_12445 [Hymenobacter busanensis]|uniref:Uncharacterized protein n=1 Tax=Hymenobacter busanensis TaxID=2607656 RepID=A0A7L5A0X9_9BACT|nr:hypothetical protein [Hymenobacter busanensis]KAA9332283.1 hypothetical protein F0P96_12445 [Hymenobacter busanensis]QHJ07380.1 hypothetical protein GUY19_08830 [Hymenobacter busanensis]
MELKDLLLTPLYLAIFYGLAFAMRKRFTNPLTKRYFIPALSVKFLGALSLGLIYQFYYGGGDTFNYFNESKEINKAFFDSPSVAFKLLLASDGEFDGSMAKYAGQMHWFNSETEYFIVKVSGFLGLFCFHTYSVIALMFALLSFSGVWALYNTFLRLYPRLYKELAIAVFFVPSVFFWGSGLAKDSLCLGALGWIFYAFYNLFVARTNIARGVLALLIAGFVLKSVKIYILISFIPPVMLWITTQYSAGIKSGLVRGLLMPFMIAIGGGIGFVVSQSVASGNQNYDFDKIEDRATVASTYHNSISHTEVAKGRGMGNSGYAMEDFTGPQDIPKLAPKAVVIGLFRPFLWEVSNPVMLLSGLEILWITYLTFQVFRKTGVLRTFSKIGSTPLVLFCVIFSVLFAIGTAITSGNFGNLVRYRIPMWPFYVTALFVLQDDYTRKQAVKKKRRAVPVRRPQLAGAA